MGGIKRTRRIQFARIDLHPTRRHAAAQIRRAAQIGNLADGRAGMQPARDLADLTLSIAIDQQIRLRIDQDRSAHMLRPVVKMRDSPQARFDAADDDGHLLVCLAQAL